MFVFRSQGALSGCRFLWDHLVMISGHHQPPFLAKYLAPASLAELAFAASNPRPLPLRDAPKSRSSSTERSDKDDVCKRTRTLYKLSFLLWWNDDSFENTYFSIIAMQYPPILATWMGFLPTAAVTCECYDFQQFSSAGSISGDTIIIFNCLLFSLPSFTLLHCIHGWPWWMARDCPQMRVLARKWHEEIVWNGIALRLLLLRRL